MAEQEQEQNRSEPATPFKLREARKRGQVAKSTEINSFAMLCAALGILYFIGGRLAQGQLELSSQLLANSHRVVLEGRSAAALFEMVTYDLLGVYWPIIAIAVVVAIAANVFQTGPVFSLFPIKPDVQRLNPVQGFKRLFSKRMLFEAIKTLTKFSILGVAVYQAIVALLPELLTLIDIPPQSYGHFLLTHARQLMFQLLLLLLLVALFDLAYNRWDFAQRMRMSRRELKDEVKRREGDPQIRAKLRQLQKEAVKRAGALLRVPEADVLITNPRHLAVALHYDGDTMTAPQVIAKGGGELARKMREVAYRYRIPIVENKSLARQLFRQTGIDEQVPEELYPIVARLMSWVLMARRRHEAMDFRMQPL
jgi:flagellar biosynthetic protein FlhB